MTEVVVGLMSPAVDGINTGVVTANEILLSQASCHIEVRVSRLNRPPTSVHVVISFLQLCKKGQLKPDSEESAEKTFSHS